MLGGMARAEAFCAARDTERTTIYSPAKREKKCAFAPSGEPGIEVVAVDAAREAPGRIDVKVRQGDAGRGDEPQSAPEERGRGAPTAFIAGAGEEVNAFGPGAAGASFGDKPRDRAAFAGHSRLTGAMR